MQQAEKMKIITTIFTVLVFSSCVDSRKSIQEKSKIELELVDEIFIKKELYGTDSIRLNKEQIELFAKEWNNAKSLGVYKMRPEFWIFVKLKNDVIRKFRVNGDLIKEQGDWAFSIGDSLLINSFWIPTYSFPKPENYTPLSFIKFVSQSIDNDSSKSYLGMSMTNEFPEGWVKEEHLEDLFELLDSKEECGCFLNPLSSYIPTGKAEIGGYARIFLKSFKDEEKVDLGLYSCPKVAQNINEELKEWLNKRK